MITFSLERVLLCVHQSFLGWTSGAQLLINFKKTRRGGIILMLFRKSNTMFLFEGEKIIEQGAEEILEML